MAIIRWGFESGSNGDTLTATNANADFSVISGGTATISTAQSFEGTRSALMTGTTTSGSAYIQKTVSSTNQLGVDTFIYLTSLPASEAGIIWLGAGTTRQTSLAVLTDGRLRIRDGAGGGGAAVWTSTPGLSLNTWYRVSIYIAQDATNGSTRAAFYNGGSATPLADSTLLTTQNTGAQQYTTFRVGPKISTSTVEMAVYFDNYGYDVSANGLIPVTSAPVVNATASTAVSLIDASSSTGTALTYSISQLSGPSQTAALVAPGKWTIPIDTESSTVWRVTITQSDSQTATSDVTVLSVSGEQPLVEMLYATGPGIFV